MSQLTGTWRKQAGLTPSSGEYAALNTVIFMGLLLVQFALGMQINLFAGLARHHAGAGAANVVPGVFDSVSWAIAHGPIVLAIHAAFGLAILVGAIHNLFWNVLWGTRGTVWATGAALLFVLAAGVNGGAFLAYDKDVYSLLMALFFGAAILCYAIAVYLLLRSPEAGKTRRSARSRPQRKGVLTHP
jgi:hypothetical protein